MNHVPLFLPLKRRKEIPPSSKANSIKGRPYETALSKGGTRGSEKRRDYARKERPTSVFVDKEYAQQTLTLRKGGLKGLMRGGGDLEQKGGKTPRLGRVPKALGIIGRKVERKMPNVKIEKRRNE